MYVLYSKVVVDPRVINHCENVTRSKITIILQFYVVNKTICKPPHNYLILTFVADQHLSEELETDQRIFAETLTSGSTLRSDW